MKLKNIQSFTIIEIMVVIIIISALAAISIPKLTQAMEVRYRRVAEDNLRLIHAANNVYRDRSNNNSFWPPDGNIYTVGQINGNLGLGIVEQGLEYECSGTNGSTFSCTAYRPTIATADYQITVNQGLIGAGNPVCTGSCP